ncbi:MAG TPA: lysylphosphatidylglycerol synthase transmembrane domain-containing protein [Kineosporiaceae bacterium]
MRRPVDGTASGGGPVPEGAGRVPARRGLLAATLPAARRAAAMVQSTPARAAFGILAVALAVWAIVSRRDQVVDALARMQGRWLLAAVLATLGNLLFTGLAWRAVLADLGSRLPLAVAARIFFVGQIGKYVPGSLWPVVVQAELGRDHGVARRRSAAATLVLILLSAFSALVVVLASLPFVPGVAGSSLSRMLFLGLPLIVVLHPRVLGRLLDRALRLVGRPPLGEWTSLRGTAASLGWALASWLCAGLQVYCLSISLSAPRAWHTLALATGGYALAWVAGFVVVVAPAGAGARELALATVLSPILGSGEVVVVVVLSRLLFTVCDLSLAATGLTVGKRAR